MNTQGLIKSNSLLCVLNEDCIVQIINKVLRPKDFWAICISCKSLMELLKKYQKDMGLYLNYKLNRDQIEILELLKNENHKDIYLNLPMNAGKTAIALIYCLERIKQYGGSALFYVPDKVIQTVKIEIEKLTGKHKQDIPIYFYSGVRDCRSINRRDQRSQGDKIPKTRSSVIITTRKCSSAIKLYDNYHTVIIDEAHTGSLDCLYTKIPQQISKVIFMSAAADLWSAVG